MRLGVYEFGTVLLSQARLRESGKDEILVLRDHLVQARESGPERHVISLRRVCLAQVRIRAC